MIEKNVNVKGHVRKTKHGAFFVKNYSRKDEVEQNNNLSKKLLIGAGAIAGAGVVGLGGYKVLKSLNKAKKAPKMYDPDIAPPKIKVIDDIPDVVITPPTEIIKPKTIQINEDEIIRLKLRTGARDKSKQLFSYQSKKIDNVPVLSSIKSSKSKSFTLSKSIDEYSPLSRGRTPIPNERALAVIPKSQPPYAPLPSKLNNQQLYPTSKVNSDPAAYLTKSGLKTQGEENIIYGSVQRANEVKGKTRVVQPPKAGPNSPYYVDNIEEAFNPNLYSTNYKTAGVTQPSNKPDFQKTLSKRELDRATPTLNYQSLYKDTWNKSGKQLKKNKFTGESEADYTEFDQLIEQRASMMMKARQYGMDFNDIPNWKNDNNQFLRPDFLDRLSEKFGLPTVQTGGKNKGLRLKEETKHKNLWEIFKQIDKYDTDKIARYRLKERRALAREKTGKDPFPNLGSPNTLDSFKYYELGDYAEFNSKYNAPFNKNYYELSDFI